jgi:hypothetical protein
VWQSKLNYLQELIVVDTCPFHVQIENFGGRISRTRIHDITHESKIQVYIGVMNYTDCMMVYQSLFSSAYLSEKAKQHT